MEDNKEPMAPKPPDITTPLKDLESGVKALDQLNELLDQTPQNKLEETLGKVFKA